jgi:hypothetical protein
MRYNAAPHSILSTARSRLGVTPLRTCPPQEDLSALGGADPLPRAIQSQLLSLVPNLCPCYHDSRLRKKSICPARRGIALHPRPVEFSLRGTAKPIQQGESLQRMSRYAPFLKIYLPLAGLSASGGFARLVPPVAGELVPSAVATFFEVLTVQPNQTEGGL